MIVKLTFLDKLKSFGYNEIGEVALAGDRYSIIGTSKFFRDENGNCFAELMIIEPIDENLYFYYTFSGNGESQWFIGIQLNEKERNGTPTTQLKDMIVKK